MTFAVNFVLSPSLNFLGYARNGLPKTDEVLFLWSRETESLFACDASVDSVLDKVDEKTREVLLPYTDAFTELWPSFRRELLQFLTRLEELWLSSSERVVSLMNELQIFPTGSVEVFPVMPFFREWPRSNPLSMPAKDSTDKKLLEVLIHEMLHRTTDSDTPGSVWHSLSMVFAMKKIPKEKRFFLQHSLIYVISSWIAADVLNEEFVEPSLIEKHTEMEKYMHSLFVLFSSPVGGKDSMEIAEEIVKCCL